MDIDLSQINGVASITWSLKTVTPLCIKSGTTSAWNQSPRDKTRQVNASFNFFDKTSTQHTIADFYYDVFIDGGQPKVRYSIPSSSVRGALRGYTIRLLVKRELWDAFLYPDDTPPEVDKKALNDPGWVLVRGLFGLAWDTSTALPDPTTSGRLRVVTRGPEELGEEEINRALKSQGFSLDRVQYPSRHGTLLFTTRNPLDRITQAARVGGLHSFMELAPGNEFKVHLEILNPIPEDLGFIALWEDAINNGTLRLGGLTSAGRGRLNVTKTKINLYSPEPVNEIEFPGISTNADGEGDILTPMFSQYNIPEWDKTRSRYLDKLKERYQVLCNKKEVNNASLHEPV